jgi:hypothetical protein
LNEKGLARLGDATQSATNIFNYDPTDLDGDYDIEDQQPRNQMHKNEIPEARLRGFMSNGRISFRHRGTNWNNNSGRFVQLSF